MFKQPFKKIQFHLLNAATPDGNVRDMQTEVDTTIVHLPIDPQVATASIYRLSLALGMNLALVKVEFTEASVGRMLNIIETEGELEGPSFQALVVRNVRGVYNCLNPDFNFAISQGTDIFRYADKYHTRISMDGSFSGEFFLLTVDRNVLDNLIGEELSEKLLKKLDLSFMPSATVKPIPQFISNYLVQAISPALVAESKKLHAQAKCLEYLAGLVDFLCTDEVARHSHDGKSKKRVEEIHAELLTIKGKLPTLDELAERHGRSAKLLNEDFSAEYGESIYSFISNHRLQQAHEAILKTTVSIKQVSADLGYSHVSNFTIAFKRKFGYPPGKLRSST